MAADEKDEALLSDAFEEKLAMTVGPGTSRTPTIPAEVPKDDGGDVKPAEPTKVPSDGIEPAERPAGEEEPTSVRFPEHDPGDGGDLGVPPAPGDSGIPPSGGLDPDDLGPLDGPGPSGTPQEGGADAGLSGEQEASGGVTVPGLGHLDEGDLMPAEVQDVTFPESGEAFDPGFTIESPSETDFGASDEVPADSFDGVDGSSATGAIDEGF